MIEHRGRWPESERCRLIRSLRRIASIPILHAPTPHAPEVAPMPMSEMQARLKPEFSLRYPRLSAGVWNDVSPIFPGVTVRRGDIFGRSEEHTSELQSR